LPQGRESWVPPKLAPKADEAQGPMGTYAALLGLFLIYGLTTTVHSMRKFWYDEFFSFYISQREGFGGIWAALKAGVDFNPPLGYMVAKGFQFLFGNGELATRLPALFGYFLLSLCLYWFISRRSSPAWGYVAAVVPWCSGAYALASEARAYGLMLGCAGLALIGWQEAASRESAGSGKRVWSLLGFGVSLSAALLSHCYASLIIIPFGAAELIRQYQARRLDRAMWIALLAPIGCVAVYFPLLGNLRTPINNNYLFHVDWTAVPLVFSYLLTPLVWPVAITALIVALPRFSSVSCEDPQSESNIVMAHEWVLAGGFVAVPLVAVFLAAVLSGQFFPRYGALGVVGLGLLVPLYLRWRGTPVRAASLVTAVFLVCYGAAFGNFLYTSLVRPPTAESASLEKLDRRKDPFEREPELPFVVAGALNFLEIDHYGPPVLLSRLYYLTDRDAAMEYTRTELFAKGYPILKGWFPIRGKIAPYQTFIRDHPRFLVYGPYAFPTDWLIKKLIDDGANLRLLSDAEGAYGDNLLFEVTPKK
jgi:hypothetical protein